MVNDAVVSIISTDFYGRSKKFKLEDISEETLVQWAVETKQLLLANPELAKTKRIIEDSISPEAKESLWSCSEKLAEVPKEYPAALRTVAERQAFHLEWLDKIVAACAPSSVSLMLHKMREVKWCEHASGDSWRHEGSWKAKDVVAYYAKLKKVENQMGDAAHTVSEKAKLDLVEHKIPSGLKLLAKSTLPRHVGDGPAPQDTWEKALMRIARELRKQEDALAMADSIRIKQKKDAPKPYRPLERPSIRLDDKFKKKKKWRPADSAERRGSGKGRGKGSGKGKSSERGGSREEKDLSHIECFNCGEKGHYSNKCPHAPRDAPRGGGKGKGKGSGKGRGGSKGAQESKADAKA